MWFVTSWPACAGLTLVLLAFVAVASSVEVKENLVADTWLESSPSGNFDFLIVGRHSGYPLKVYKWTNTKPKGKGKKRKGKRIKHRTKAAVLQFLYFFPTFFF